MIHIINKRNRPYNLPPNTHIFSVDRSSPLGNPFFMKAESERDKVCDQYEQYFKDTLVENINTGFLNQFNELIAAAKQGDIALACWCAPKRCHAETIKRAIESTIRVDDVYVIPATGGPVKVVFEEPQFKQYIAKIQMRFPREDAEKLISHFTTHTGKPAYFNEYLSLDICPEFQDYRYMFYAHSEAEAISLVESLYQQLKPYIKVGEYFIKERIE